MNEVILLKQGEIVLKGLNRREFESTLMTNIKRRLPAFGDFSVYSRQSTVYVEPLDNSDGESCDIDGALEMCKTVFGIASISKAAVCEKDNDAIVDMASLYLKQQLDSVRSFKVESRRADKSFHMGSIELSQHVGGLLHDRFPHLTPKMQDPDFTVFIEIRDHAAYIHGPAERGAGGLPVGSGGRMVALLSGGIDSPVAMHMIAKRGVRVLPVHFFSPPYTSEMAKEKVLNLAKILSKYCGQMTVRIVPFTRIQEEIRKNCPEGLLTIIMRRFMMRIAEHIASENRCTALVTGDNLGQVASQTAEALAAVEQCIDLPVLRPVIAFDKKDIVDSARQIGTYETSIQPYDDCCAVFTPRRPRTKPKLDEVLTAESALSISELVSEAIEGVENS